MGGYNFGKNIDINNKGEHYDLTFPFLVVYSREFIYFFILRNPCKHSLTTATLFLKKKKKTLGTTKCMSVRACKYNLWYIHKMK